MSIIFNNEAHLLREGAMISALKIQPSDELLDKINKEDEIKKRLACLESRKSMIQSRDRIPNAREQMETSLKLLKFVADSDLTLTQVNGQRKLGPPPDWTGPAPGPKCEIFVGNIPRNYYEPEIVLIFGTVGRIYELRLMMEFSGTNRGYCFIMYTTEDEAARAVRELDQYEVYPGKRIGVVASTNNCRLFINQLPRAIESASIIRRICEVTDDIDKVAVYRNLNDFVCYVLVSFKTHRGTAMGRRRLVPESEMLFKNCAVNVEWANPNMTPSNVYEESGTCDEHGNVKISKTFIEQVKSKKVIVRARHKIMERRASIINGHRSQKFLDSTVQKGRPIRAATENLSKTPENQYNPEACRSKNSACCHCSTMELASSNECKTLGNFCPVWDYNGNLKQNPDQSLLYERLKNYTRRDQSHPILPSISTYLNKGKRLRAIKWHDENKFPKATLRNHENFHVLAKNFPHVPPNLFNNACPLNCPCEFNSSNSFDPPRSRSYGYQSGNIWNTTDSLVEKFPDALKITDENDNPNFPGHDRRNAYKNQQQAPAESNIGHVLSNFSVANAPNGINQQIANCIPRASYYQHFPINTTEQNNGIAYTYFPNQGVGYNVQNFLEPSLFHKESNPNREYNISQQTLSNDIKPVMINQNFNWCSPAQLANNIYCRDSRKVVDIIPNGISSNHNQFGNNHQMVNSSQQQNYEAVLNTSVSKFDGRFAYENRGNPMLCQKDTFAENKAEFGENFRRL